MIAISLEDIHKKEWQTIVNPISRIGRDPDSLISKHYKEMNKELAQLKADGIFDMGRIYLYRHPKQWASILNVPVRPTPEWPVDLDILEHSLRAIVACYQDWGLEGLAMPQIGYNIPGSPDWFTVLKPLIYHYLDPIDLFVVLHEHYPQGEEPAWAKQPILRQVQ